MLFAKTVEDPKCKPKRCYFGKNQDLDEQLD